MAIAREEGRIPIPRRWSPSPNCLLQSCSHGVPTRSTLGAAMCAQVFGSCEFAAVPCRCSLRLQAIPPSICSASGHKGAWRPHIGRGRWGGVFKKRMVPMRTTRLGMKLPRQHNHTGLYWRQFPLGLWDTRSHSRVVGYKTRVAKSNFILWGIKDLTFIVGHKSCPKQRQASTNYRWHLQLFQTTSCPAKADRVSRA